MKDLLLLIAFLLAWFALQKWILPRLGVPTRMSQTCDPGSRDQKKPVLPDQK